MILKTDNMQTKKSSKLVSAANAIRAVSTVLVLTVPLIAGAAAIIGCGIYKMCKSKK